MISVSLIAYAITLKNAIPVSMAHNAWAPGILRICGVAVEVTGVENLDRSRPCVLVCNHQSYLDIPILFLAIPLNLYFVAKKELKWIPFLGWYMMATGMIFIDRSNRERSMLSLSKAAVLIRKGRNVLMFPEGTRSMDGQVGGFKKGSFVLARQAGVDIVPVGIREPQPFVINRPARVQRTVHIGVPMASSEPSLGRLIKKVQQEVGTLSDRRQAPVHVSVSA